MSLFTRNLLGINKDLQMLKYHPNQSGKTQTRYSFRLIDLDAEDLIEEPIYHPNQIWKSQSGYRGRLVDLEEDDDLQEFFGIGWLTKS